MEEQRLLPFLVTKKQADVELVSRVRERMLRASARVFHPIADDIANLGHLEYWLKGGRGSTKSSFISLRIVTGLVAAPQANAIIYRKVAATLRESVYAQVAWAIETLGLTEQFIFRSSPLEIIYAPTGQKILFKGADDPGKSKSIKLARGYFRFLWFEEVTEFGGEEELRTIKVSVMRGKGKGQVIVSYNPPISAQNWTNAAAMVDVPGRLVHHSTYLDVPPEWLGEAFLHEAAALQQTNERAYRHTYLGEVTGTGGQVFDNLKLGAFDASGFDRFNNGLDFGFAVDPDALIRCHYRKATRELFILAEIYKVRMSAEALADKAKRLCGQEPITCDSQDPRMISTLSHLGLHTRAAKKGPGSREHGMRWLQDLAAIYIDPAVCPNAAREFAGYEYKRDRMGNFMAAYPDGEDHCLTGDTLVETTMGAIPICDLVGKTGELLCLDIEKGAPVTGRFFDCRKTRGNAPLVAIELEDGREITCTADHPVYTALGWKLAGALTELDEIVCIEVAHENHPIPGHAIYPG